MSRRRIVILVSLLVALAVGSAAFVLTRMVDLPDAVTSRTWTLQQFTLDGQDQTLTTTPVLKNTPLQLRFRPQDHSVVAHGVCNDFSASYSASFARLTFHGWYQSLVGCFAWQRLEENYFDALSQVQTYQLDGDTLMLRDDAGHVFLRFAPSNEQ